MLSRQPGGSTGLARPAFPAWRPFFFRFSFAPRNQGRRVGLAMDTMRTILLAAAALAGVAAPGAGQPAPVAPFESPSEVAVRTPLDVHVLARLKEKRLVPAFPCSDAVFLRRVFVDLIGTLPTPEEARAFLGDQTPGKRARLVESLFGRDEFADYWAMKWCDVLRVKAEFPVNLWPNAVQAYHRWIRDAVRTNRPYDQFARELLTASGSNFRVPPVNFLRAVQGREPSALAAAAGLTFMGTRLDRWTPAKRAGLEAFFSRVEYKQTGEWKEEIVQLVPAPTTPLRAVLPDGTRVTVAAGDDPRHVFADWLVAPGNPWFARAMANRAWSWFFGRGIVHEPDDIRPSNPPVNPALLAFLEKEFTASKFDLRQLMRLIVNSATYQQSSIAQGDPSRAAEFFACYPVRRLEAEVLADALNALAGRGESYQSPIPEPFTFTPESQRAIALPDGSITSSFLEMFGRPSRDTGLESERNNQPTDAQRLHFLNSSNVQRKIEQGLRFRRLIEDARGNRGRMVDNIYLSIVSRFPTPAEREVVRSQFPPGGGNARAAAADLAWALLNSKEFLYRH